MVDAQVLEAYMHFTLMYTADHILLAFPIKDLINRDKGPTLPFKLATGTKPSLLHIRILFCPCVVKKSTAHVGTKTLNMSHKAQNVF